MSFENKQLSKKPMAVVFLGLELKVILIMKLKNITCLGMDRPSSQSLGSSFQTPEYFSPAEDISMIICRQQNQSCRVIAI